MNTYEQGRRRLIDQAAAMDKGWSPTPLKKEITGLADRLIDLADDLDGGSNVWDDIENEHDKAPQPLIGPDGLPYSEPDSSCSYKATLMHMRALADSAKHAADSLPNSRKRFALPFAAMGLLHLSAWHDKRIGAIDVGSPSVKALREICEAAGIFVSDETLRNALRTELNQFDPYYFPPGIWEIISGD